MIYGLQRSSVRSTRVTRSRQLASSHRRIGRGTCSLASRSAASVAPGSSWVPANRLCCFGARDQGTCSNKLTIRRDEVEARVLKALQEKLLRQDLFEEFCDEFTREMN